MFDWLRFCLPARLWARAYLSQQQLHGNTWKPEVVIFLYLSNRKCKRKCVILKSVVLIYVYESAIAYWLYSALIVRYIYQRYQTLRAHEQVPTNYRLRWTTPIPPRSWRDEKVCSFWILSVLGTILQEKKWLMNRSKLQIRLLWLLMVVNTVKERLIVSEPCTSLVHRRGPNPVNETFYKLNLTYLDNIFFYTEMIS